MRTPTLPLIALLSIASLSACGERRPPAGAAGAAKVLATVNGTAITEADVEQRLRGYAGAGPGHEVPASVLETLVRDELVYQKAVQLGLDREPGYRGRVDAMRAQLRALERQQIAPLFMAWVRNQAAVTDAEAREWFERNGALVRTRFHVLQILSKGDRDAIAKDHADVKAGIPFEEVAARRSPALPAGAKAPWDLAELHWQQMPPAWRGIVDRMEPGQVSDVIAGPNGRFWVVKLVGRTEDPAVAFESAKERIKEQLRQQKADELYGRTVAELTSKATVVYPR